MSSGYVTPLYLQPMYQQQIALRRLGVPFRCPHTRARSLSQGPMPGDRVDRERRMITTEFMRPGDHR